MMFSIELDYKGYAALLTLAVNKKTITLLLPLFNLIANTQD